MSVGFWPGSNNMVKVFSEPDMYFDVVVVLLVVVVAVVDVINGRDLALTNAMKPLPLLFRADL